jgi:hypothetical protein
LKDKNTLRVLLEYPDKSIPPVIRVFGRGHSKTEPRDDIFGPVKEIVADYSGVI